MTMIRNHQPRRKGEKVMKNVNRKGRPEVVLPPITVKEDDAKHLNALASSCAVLFPRAAHFLAQEIERASVVADNCDLPGVVHMGSQVRYCDETGETRDMVLVYPHEADITLKRVSVLTPVGAALIGLSVGQAIEFQTPGHNKRSLTVLGVSNGRRRRYARCFN
jgi:regulator of nucleoside diphosphate kinase